MSERGPREGLVLPILIPVVTLVAIVGVLIGFSRILLNTSAAAATSVALVAAVAVIAIAAFVSGRKHLSNAALFSMIGGAAGVAMLAGGVALLVAPPHGEEGEGGPAVVILAPPGAAADGFAEDAYTVPADVAFEIGFDNQDPGVPHNVFIATEEGGTNLFEGMTVNGPTTTTYSVEEPLAEGDYFFFCSIHPSTMTGTLSAVPGAGEGGGGEGGGPGGGVTVVAAELAFETTEFELPADTPTTITFDNRDDVGTFGQHNVSIYEDDSFTTPLFQGELIAGPATVEYEIPPLPEGTYPFRCDVHPQMLGVVNVVAGGGGGGGEGDAPEEPEGG